MLGTWTTKRSKLTRSVALAAVGMALATSRPAGAASGSAKAELDPDWANAPSARYAALTRDACLAELHARAISFELVAEAPGVVTPVRTLDGIGGVLYRTAQSREKRATSPHEVLDCRLVLALHDLSAILRQHDVDEVLMFSGWRPPPKSWPKDKPAVRHPAAMAIDVFKLGRWVTAAESPRAQPAGAGAEAPKTEGKAGAPTKGDEPQATGAQAGAPPEAKRTREWLDVKEHFGGAMGTATCGPEAPKAPVGPEGTRLRSIVCEAASRRLFTSILTPNYDRAHHNHIHLDLAPGARWRLVR